MSPEPSPDEGAVTAPETGSNTLVFDPEIVSTEDALWHKVLWSESAVGGWKPATGYGLALAVGR